MTMADTSIRLCAVDDIAERSARGFEIAGTSLFAVKFDGRIHVYRNSCPHLGVELNWLENQFFDLDDQLLQCATHGALFDPASGACVAGPCRGRALEPIASSIEDGQLYLEHAPSSSA